MLKSDVKKCLMDHVCTLYCLRTFSFRLSLYLLNFNKFHSDKIHDYKLIINKECLISFFCTSSTNIKNLHTYIHSADGILQRNNISTFQLY